MRQLALTKASLLTPFNLIEDATLLIQDNKILAAGPESLIEIPTGFRNVPLDGFIIAPGFIDQHVHGGGGAEVMTASPEAMIEIAKFHATHGVTSFLATTTSAPQEKLIEIGNAYEALNRTNYKGAKCLGLHLEGPYLSENFPGVHSSTTFRAPSLDEIMTIHRVSNFGVKMVTMAPELQGAIEIGSYLSDIGIACSIGHSNSNYDTSLQAVQAGFSCVTHCFNQMNSFNHREPGILGVALTQDDISVEMIVDGIHLHKATVEIVWRLKGPERIILVSDAMMPTGKPDGLYHTFNGDLVLTQGCIRNEDGKLAGSTLTLDVAAKNFMKFTDCGLTDVFRMITYNPARNLGINRRKGSLYPGKDADLIVMTTDLEVIMTMVGGEVISGLITLD